MDWRKGISMVLIVVLVLTFGMSGSYAETDGGAESTNSQGTAAATTGTFTDISGHWAETIIKEAADLGIVGGYLDGTYLPDNLIKREEFFKLLTNILTEKPDTANTKILFTDVVADEWYVPTIKTAVAAGITSGYGDGTFGVGLMISRQEAAKVAGSVIPAYDVDGKGGVEQVRDKDKIADWAYPYVDLMFKKGYMKGDTEGDFRPTTALTRAEAATILLNVRKSEPIIGANASELAVTACMEAHDGQEGVFVKGTGTKNDPYEIATEEQLNHLRMHTSEGAYYILTKNIAITKDYAVTPPAIVSELNWTEGNFVPIGSKAEPFQGFLDGSGYTISGLIISGTVGSGSSRTTASYTGLFGYLAKGSSVTDLIIDASTITGNQYTGAIAGYNEGTIKDCQLGKKGIVNGKTYTGGIAGFSSQPMSSLRNKGTVTGNSAIGGVAGAIDAIGELLNNCRNEGIVTGNEKVGGIVGIISSTLGTGSVKKCQNEGNVKGSAYNTGGIAGVVSGSNTLQIEACVNSGTVSGSGVNGGIAGLVDSLKIVITQSRNAGTVAGSYAGGIAGHNRGTIISCYNTGKVDGNTNAGGIAAYQQDGEGKISKSYNEGWVTSKDTAGGIVGINGSKIDKSYNSGSVTATNYAGGITGKNTGSVSNVYGAGVVSGNNGEGSLAGRNSGALSKAFWLDSSAAIAVGLDDGSANHQSVRKVTHEELSGQIKIKTTNGYELVLDIMNANSASSSITSSMTESEMTWKYLYDIVSSGDSKNNLISDGGGIVPPIGLQSTDSTGNEISQDDRKTKYLYPVLNQ